MRCCVSELLATNSFQVPVDKPVSKSLAYKHDIKNSLQCRLSLRVKKKTSSRISFKASVDLNVYARGLKTIEQPRPFLCSQTKMPATFRLKNDSKRSCGSKKLFTAGAGCRFCFYLFIYSFAYLEFISDGEQGSPVTAFNADINTTLSEKRVQNEYICVP